MPDMRREKFAALDAVMAGGSDREGGGQGPLVVLLHGFGAPGEDLVPLWRVLDVPSETRFIFPAAPLEIDPSWGGRAWWMIDVMALQMAIMNQRASLDGTGRAREISAGVPDGLPEARALMMDFLDEVEARLKPPKLVLGGFSQGAMLSLDVALHRAKPPDGVVLLSGTLLAEREWVGLMPARKSLPVFQSHGMQDPLLPFAAAERLRDHLTQSGLPVDWVPFRGQHEIPEQVLDRLGAFLTRTLR
jgi:phospholipase/carboxylesterase